MKYAGNLVAKNIAKTTGIRSGTEVEFRGLVWAVVLALGARYNYVVAVSEKKERQRLHRFSLLLQIQNPFEDLQ